MRVGSFGNVVGRTDAVFCPENARRRYCPASDPRIQMAASDRPSRWESMVRMQWPRDERSFARPTVSAKSPIILTRFRESERIEVCRLCSWRVIVVRRKNHSGDHVHGWCQPTYCWSAVSERSIYAHFFFSQRNQVFQRRREGYALRAPSKTSLEWM